MQEKGGVNFISLLLEKLVYVKKVQELTGRSTLAAQLEVERQIRQAMKGGNPVRGDGVTKSGEER